MSATPPSPLFPPPLPGRAAWWTWPLILLSVASFVALAAWSKRDPGGGVSGVESPEGEREIVNGPDWSLLAIFKLQSQVIIGATALDPAQAKDMLRQLESHANDAHSVAALAIVAQFVIPGEAGRSESAALLAGESDPGEASGLLARIDGALATGVDDDERTRIAAELGWFAELLPQRADDGDRAPPPEAAAIRARSMAVAAVMGVLMLVALGAILLGIGLLVAFLVNARNGVGTFRFDPTLPRSNLMLEVFAVYLGAMAAGEWIGMVFPVAAGGVVLMVVPVLLGLGWYRVRGFTWPEFRHLLGWTRGKGWWREIAAGLVGYVGMLPIVVIGITATWLLTLLVGEVSAMRAEAAGELPTPQAPVTHPVVGWVMQGGWIMKLIVLALAAVFAPVVEETFFRGAFHRGLRANWRFLGSAATAGVIFALLHPQGWLAVPALTAMGIGFALIREWRDSLVAPMVAHAINNGLIVGLISLAL